MASNLVLSLVLASALQYLWGMVNSLQIMVLGMFFKLLFPANSAIIQTEILKSCAFDFFHTEIYYQEIFNFKDSDSLTELFEDAEISGSIFIIGIGPVFIFITLFPLYILSHKMANYLCKGETTCKCCQNFLGPKNFSIIAMAFLLEGCLELGLTASICVLMVSIFDSLNLISFSVTFCIVDNLTCMNSR